MLRTYREKIFLIEDAARFPQAMRRGVLPTISTQTPTQWF
jgi:hypothetical protein